MVELDQYKTKLADYDGPLAELKASLQLTSKKERIAELERYMEAPDFWTDPDRSQKITRELKGLQNAVKTYEGLESQKEDIELLLEMGYEENDPSIIPEIEETLTNYVNTIEEMRVCR